MIKIPLYFRTNAVFEGENEFEIWCIGKATTNIQKQNPVCNDSYMESEVTDILQSGFYEAPLA